MQENYVKIPKDLSLIKQKFVFGLTKRQAVCFGVGLVCGLAAFFAVKIPTDNMTLSTLALGIVAAPAIFCGLYDKNGVKFEEQVKLMFSFFKKPKVRTYRSDNKFLAIERQIEYNRLNKLLIESGFTSGFDEKKKVNLFAKRK